MILNFDESERGTPFLFFSLSLPRANNGNGSVVFNCIIAQHFTSDREVVMIAYRVTHDDEVCRAGKSIALRFSFYKQSCTNWTISPL